MSDKNWCPQCGYRRYGGGYGPQKVCLDCASVEDVTAREKQTMSDNQEQQKYEPLSEAELALAEKWARHDLDDGEPGAERKMRYLATIRDLQGQVSQWEKVCGWLAHEGSFSPEGEANLANFSDSYIFLYQGIDVGTIKAVRKLVSKEG